MQVESYDTIEKCIKRTLEINSLVKDDLLLIFTIKGSYKVKDHGIFFDPGHLLGPSD